MVDTSQEVVAILRRNAEGTLEKLNSVHLEDNEDVRVLFTSKGLIILIGDLLPQDEDMLRIIEELM